MTEYDKEFWGEEQITSGTILWHMEGTRQNDKIHWKAIPRMVESVENHIFRFYSGGGISCNCVGSMYFTSKKECERHWKKHHDSFEELIGFDELTPEGIDELPRTNWETFEVNRFDGVDSCAVYAGGLDRLVNITDELDWHTDKDHVAEYGMEVEYLTLHEISEQLQKKILLTVFINSPRRSKVFQYGNYGDSWVFLGDIQGYA